MPGGRGDRELPAMPRRPEDTAGAAGRSVGLRPAPPALPGGSFPRDPSVRWPLGMCQPRGWSDGRQRRGFLGAPVLQLPRARSVSALGVPLGARRGWGSRGLIELLGQRGGKGDSALLPLLVVARACAPHTARWYPQVPHVTHCHQPFRSGGAGRRVSSAGETWLARCSHAVVCSGQGYLAQQFKAAVAIPGSRGTAALREGLGSGTDAARRARALLAAAA